MKTERVVTGIVFIILGLLFLMANIGVFSWGVVGSIWKLWPIILVLIGVDMVINHEKLKLVVMIVIIIISMIIWILHETASGEESWENVSKEISSNIIFNE